MEEERDFVVFTDDDGNEFELDVIDYFDYEDQEYAVLMDLSELDEGEDDACTCEDEQDVYIMKIVVDGDSEEFLPADDDKMEALAAIVEKRLAECDCDCDCDDECEGTCSCDGGCECGCHEEK
ncbi:MAG: DUF1292 domain-containing protein [Clostridia bacterium]